MAVQTAQSLLGKHLFILSSTGSRFDLAFRLLTYNPIQKTLRCRSTFSGLCSDLPWPQLKQALKKGLCVIE